MPCCENHYQKSLSHRYLDSFPNADLPLYKKRLQAKKALSFCVHLSVMWNRKRWPCHGGCLNSLPGWSDFLAHTHADWWASLFWRHLITYAQCNNDWFYISKTALLICISQEFFPVQLFCPSHPKHNLTGKGCITKPSPKVIHSWMPSVKREDTILSKQKVIKINKNMKLHWNILIWKFFADLFDLHMKIGRKKRRWVNNHNFQIILNCCVF